MDKKINTWAFAVLVLAVAVLLVGAIGTSTTGHGIFDWLKKSPSKVQETSGEEYYGVLGQKYFESGEDLQYLKNYEVKYDSEGRMIYEVVDGYIWSGDDYELTEDSENPLMFYYSLIGSSGQNGGYVMVAPGGGPIFEGKGSCICKDNPLPENSECRRIHNFGGKCMPTSGSACQKCERENPSN